METLNWIRDCWSLFISNLSQIVTEKDLFGHFREGVVVFNVFIPRNRVNGSSRGFDFIRYKTEWDARKAITFLNGRSIGGSRT